MPHTLQTNLLLIPWVLVLPSFLTAHRMCLLKHVMNNSREKVAASTNSSSFSISLSCTNKRWTTFCLRRNQILPSGINALISLLSNYYGILSPHWCVKLSSNIRKTCHKIFVFCISLRNRTKKNKWKLREKFSVWERDFKLLELAQDGLCAFSRWWYFCHFGVLQWFNKYWVKSQ